MLLEECYTFIRQKSMELFKHQQELLDRNPSRFLLSWGTGTGKTGTALRLAEFNCQSTLIICPKTLKENWRREVMRWLGVLPVVFDKKIPNARVPTGFLIMSKEEFKKYSEVMQPFAGVIVDEAHTFAGMGSALSKSLLKYLRVHKVEYRWLLTATPFLRNAWNVYMLGKLLGYDWEYAQFRSKFFYERFMGGRTFWDARPGMQQDVAALVHVLGSTVKLEDCVDIPDAVFETEYFPLTSEQRKAMKDVSEPMPITRFTKYHQICGGALKGNEYEEPKFFETEKLKRVQELAESNDKFIISCRYLSEMDLLCEKLGPDYMVYRIDGSVLDKQAVLDVFNVEPNAILVVNAACSEGWQAPSAQLMVFYSYDFSFKNKVQMEGRVRRIDRPQKVTYLALVCEDSIDEAVVDALNRKLDFDQAIYQYYDGPKISSSND